MTQGRSYTFSHAISRRPGASICDGLRAADYGNPDHTTFLEQHEAYVAALRSTGAEVTVLDALEDFPDSVFVEDAALCLGGTAIALRPGAPSRFGEAARPQSGPADGRRGQLFGCRRPQRATACLCLDGKEKLGARHADCPKQKDTKGFTYPRLLLLS